MTKKNLVLPIGIIFLLISTVGVIFFNYLPEKRIPTNGFHIIEHRGYYAFQDNESKIIDLDVYFVNNNIDNNNTLIQKYSDLSLVSPDGIQYPFELSSDEIDYFMKKSENDKYESKIIEQLIKIDLSKLNISKESIEFVQFKYKNEKGQIIKKNLGKIEVDFIKESDDVAAISRRLSWTHFEQPTFTEVEYTIENKSKYNLEISNIYYGSIGVNVQFPSSIILKPSEIKEYKYDVKLTDEKFGEPIVYMLKPKVIYKIDGIDRNGLLANVSTEKYFSSDMDLCEYLYNKERMETQTEK